MFPLLFSLLKMKGSQKAVEKALGAFIKKSQEKSAILRVVKNNRKIQKVDYLFDKELIKRSWKRASNKLSYGEQLKRMHKKGNIKNYFKQYSGKNLKRQGGFAWNQGKLLGPILSASRVIDPVMNARATEKSILRRLTMTNKKRVTDRSPLNSSWCYFGVGQAYTAQEDYWLGTLFLTVKHEHKDGTVTIGRTYTYNQFPLTVWSLMKAALGRDGTGAGTVYGKTYFRGGRGTLFILLAIRKH